MRAAPYRPGAGGEANREGFESAMKTVDATFQVRQIQASGSATSCYSWASFCRLLWLPRLPAPIHSRQALDCVIRSSAVQQHSLYDC
jgi:hypothetical protein